MNLFQRILCFLCFLSILFAKPISVDQAEGVALNMFPQKTIEYCKKTSNNLYLTTFHHGGFVLSSADDGFPAILAYSENAPVGQNNPAFRDYCKQYNNEIRSLKSSERAAHPDWASAATGSLNKSLPTAAVQPLITSTWNQSPYYNDNFPYFILPGYSTKKPYVGCVAVVMGQLMNYYEHPQKGFGKRWYYSETTDSLLEAWHDTTYYDYENMPDSLCTRDGVLTAYADQVRDVALFLYQSAVAVEMDLQPDGSSAAYEDMMYALTSHYDYGIEMIQREKADTTELAWKNMIKQELDAGRPLPYRGQGDGGGHAFLLDGYQTTTNTYFHFNWGWGGYYDGWFLLSALNPEEGYDYTDLQAAVFNVHPNTDDITRYAYTSFEGLQAGWTYEGGWFYPDNGAYDMVRSGELAYGFDTLNQWLITPKIHIPNNDNVALSLWAHMLNSNRECKILLSQTDTAKSSFTTELATIAPNNSNWTEYVYNLRPYKNSAVYIGFKYDQDHGYITLDDLTLYTPKVVIGTKDIVPETHELLTVFPNPFNPRTTLSYQLSSSSDVELTIYNMNGKWVSTLVNDSYEKGSYSFQWNASGYASGIYIAALKVNGTTRSTQKLVLVK
jgi:Peptidase C10 family/Secretion system C-terminal sorting domain/Spi protease inhibitor